MPEHIVVDASAWIEYLDGSKKGKEVEKHFKKKTPVMNGFTVMEVCAYANKKGQDDREILRTTLQQVLVVEVEAELAANSARFYHVANKKRRKISYGDAIVAMTADYMESQLITCDNDFAGMKNVTVIR